MTEINNPVKIYEGLVVLKSDNTEEINAHAIIEFKWLPTPSVKISGNTNFTDSILSNFIQGNRPIDVYADKTHFGRFRLRNLSTTIGTSVSSTSFDGKFINPMVVGNMNSSVEEVHFEIANLRSLGTNQPIVLESNDCLIELRKRNDYDELYKELKKEGGYASLHTGILKTKNNNKIGYKRANSILESLTYFLHFLNGRRCAPILRKGISLEKERWIDYTPYITDVFAYDVSSWPQKHTIEGLSQLWSKFHELWKDESEQEVLKTSLHWYVEANLNSGYVEGSLTMIQNTLELLFSWILVETSNYLLESSETEKIPASAKIGILLSYCKISPHIPASLKELAKLKNVKNGPDAITYIRNKIVHPKRTNRESFRNISNGAKYESLQLGLWYVELILLHYLDYKGKYYNRCSLAEFADSGEETVPWNL